MDYGNLGVSKPRKPPSIPSTEPPPLATGLTLNLKLLPIFVVIIIVATVVSSALVVHLQTKPSGSGSQKTHPQHTQAISRTYSCTRYQGLYVNSLVGFPRSLTASEKDLVYSSVNRTLRRVGKALFSSSDISNLQMEVCVRSAYEDCHELLEESVDHLLRSLFSVVPSSDDGSGDRAAATSKDVVTWLSTVLTNQDTCTEGLLEAESGEVLIRHSARKQG